MDKNKTSKALSGADLVDDHKKMLEQEKEIDRQLANAEKDLEEPEEEEPDPEWDGSESEFVEDDDAQVYDESYSGINLSYSLKADEIEKCLTHCNYEKKSFWVGLIRTIFVIFAFLTCTGLFFHSGNIAFLFLGLLLTLLFILSTLFPKIEAKVRAKRLAFNSKIDVDIFPEEIEINLSGKKWVIKLDGSAGFEEFDGFWILFLPQNKIFVIPTRAIEPDLLAEIQAMIISGTTPIDS